MAVKRKDHTLHEQRPAPGRVVVGAISAFYSALILWLMLFARLEAAQAVSLAQYAHGHLELVPLRTIAGQLTLAAEGNLHAISNLGGNVLLFAPFGWLLPSLFRPLRRYRRFIAVFAGSVAAVELAQLLLRVGFCDVDDLLLNALGASLGFLLWRLTRDRPVSLRKQGRQHPRDGSSASGSSA